MEKDNWGIREANRIFTKVVYWITTETEKFKMELERVSKVNPMGNIFCLYFISCKNVKD